MASMRSNTAVHVNVRCDNCGMSPILGTRYRCRQCVGYDLCQNCKNHGIHNIHIMERQDTASSKNYKYHAVHEHIECDNCGMNPIIGTRYKCSQCVDYDICQNCRNSGIHVITVMGSNISMCVAPPSAVNDEVHMNARCAYCNMQPIVGNLYKCDQCPDYDLCQKCKDRGVHGEHTMLRSFA